MAKIRVAINGFGRIGRLTLRALLQNQDVEVIAINDIADPQMLAHLFKYDSVQGRFKGECEAGEGVIKINGHSISCSAERDPASLPWKALNIDIVLESTGKFRSASDCGKHITAGAKKVVLSAPAKGDVTTVVMGVNDNIITAQDTIVSNASCTTNCLAPMLKILDDHWGIESGFLSTIHAYTSDQRLQDAPHKDYRRARAAALSIIPTTTGAAIAATQVLPKLTGKLFGKAMRVPVPDGSLTDLICRLEKPFTEAEINQVFEKAAQTEFKNIIEYSKDPLVSVDIIGNPHSVIFDSLLTSKHGQDINVVGWYDNEGGYAHRAADLIYKLGSLL